MAKRQSSSKKTKKCPVCKNPLTVKEYEKAMGIVKQKEVELKRAKEDAKKSLKSLDQEKKKLQTEKKKFQMEKKSKLEALKKKNEELKKVKANHKKEMVKTVKAENEKVLKKQATQLDKMQVANKKMKQQLELAKTGRSEADMGFAEEQRLAKELRKLFPGDDIKVVGKGGDVLHTIKRNGKMLDSIIYECKKVANHTTAHVGQTARAKSSRGALFGVLVTTGKSTKTFKGFNVEKGISIVRPEAVLVIAKILRDQILDIDKLKIEEGKKNKVANRALRFLNSTNFKTPINTVIRIAEDNVKELNKEVKDHVRYWTKRFVSYKSLADNIELIRENSGRAIKGETLRKLGKAKPNVAILIPELK